MITRTSTASTPRAQRAWLALLLACVLAFLPASLASADARIDATFRVSDAQVAISGRLLDGADGIGPHVLLIGLDDVEVGRTTTSGSGDFSAAVPLPAGLSGRHVVSVYFAGTEALPPVDARHSFEVARGPVQTTLKASGPAEAINGDVITISGSLTTAAGAGVAGAGIAISDPSGNVPDSYTVSGGDGAFSTLYAVPEDQAEGSLTVTVTYAGATGFATSSGSVKLAVRRMDVQTPSPSPTASPTPSASVSASATASAPAIGSPSLSPTAPPAEADDDPSVLSPVAIALVVVGGSAILALALVAFKGSVSRRQIDDGEMDFFDEAGAPFTPVPEAPVSDGPAQNLAASRAVDDRPAEPAAGDEADPAPRPTRRAAPSDD